ncbi:MAG: RIP metalloprotease RseP [Candidatus Aminicenantes bacterium]|nr:RIP metalloprotease RseP [Candidatus Aminicenantes bacterium]
MSTILNILGQILAFVIVFGVLVFFHEFGHFFMAKLVGIRVEAFSFGYGKRLFGIKKGDTDYRISMVPIGGFVKFTGEDVFEQKRELEPGDFMAASRWQRFLVMVMGSLMNIVLAILLVTIINMVGTTSPAFYEKAPVIGWIESGSPAEKASFLPNDEIISIDGKETKTWTEMEIAVGTRPDRTLKIEVKRNGQIIPIDLKTESRSRLAFGYAGFRAQEWTQVSMITANSPAEKGGLENGDIILAINGETVFRDQFVKIVESSPEKELEFLVDRNGEQKTLNITPKREGEIGKIGIGHGIKSIIKKYGFFGAIGESINFNVNLAFMVIDFLKDLITGEASAKQLGGPLEIANFSYAALRAGFMAMLQWIAFFSLQLGIINLFPIPVLDGGQILVLGLEGLFRRDFSPKVKQIVMQIGFALFIILIVFVLLNDIAKRLPNGWGSLIPF